MQPISIDLLLHCRWLLPIVPDNQVLQDYSVAIDGGRIIDILPIFNAKEKYLGSNTELLDRHILMPGLINAHCHSSSRLLRGIKSDLQPKEWLDANIFGPETVFSDSKFIWDSTNLAIAEMIKTGTTCFAEMHSSGELFVDIVRKAGIRSQFNFALKETSTIFGKDANDYLHRGLKLRDDFSSYSLIKLACGISDSCNIEDTTLEQLASFTNELDLPVQIECNQTTETIETCLKEFGCRPLQRLFDQGLLLPETQLVHMNLLDPEDSALLEKTKSHVVVCTEANQMLANKNYSLDQLMEADINLSIGTAGAASNNDLNLMTDIRATAVALKGGDNQHSREETAYQALRMATINGAKTLGWDSQIGSIENGKYADLIAIEIDSIHHQPLYNPATQLVYNSSNSPVTHSWVGGQPLLKDGNLCTVDEQKLIQSAKDWGKKLGN